MSSLVQYSSLCSAIVNILSQYLTVFGSVIGCRHHYVEAENSQLLQYYVESPWDTESK